LFEIATGFALATTESDCFIRRGELAMTKVMKSEQDDLI